MCHVVSESSWGLVLDVCHSGFNVEVPNVLTLNGPRGSMYSHIHIVY